ncbi:Gm11213 [Phodopus roborovskii]|uniref:Gm11213 protein n=1 Tax=Phodopus roborovskii TaxID=109678 RepID=A0AAU9ZGQ3_PHORO|nr:Gm11213 [Phodopus roborovskii]
MASKIFCCCCKVSESTLNTAVCYYPRKFQHDQPRSFNTNISSHQKCCQRRYSLNSSDNWPVFKTCNLRRP